ncbi:MAG: hypothetical protein U0T82_04800 [Bacteroidales bacterium]
MKSLNFSYFSMLFIFLVIVPACNEKDSLPKDEWIKVDSIKTPDSIAKQLSAIYHPYSNCLSDFTEDTVAMPYFNPESLDNSDTCHTSPYIDFSTRSIIAGRVFVGSISDKIHSIELTRNDYQMTYHIVISIDVAEYGYTMNDYKYFWRFYPKLNPSYTFKTEVITE